MRGGSDYILIDGGATRNRRVMPPIEKPISCVDMTSSHWSKSNVSRAMGTLWVTYR